MAPIKHGDSKSPEYNSWACMIQRCYDENHDTYERYGALGITVCDEWRTSYAAFLAHIGRKPSPRHTIDRIDGTKGYEPGNVRWATPLEQSRNTKQTHLLTWNGKTLCLSEWSEITGIGRKTIARRLQLGWEVQRALTESPRNYNRPEL